MRLRWNRGLWALLWIAAWTCASETSLRADDQPAEAKTAQMADAESLKAEVDPFVVPKGTPEQLLQFLDDLMIQRPKSNAPDDVRQYREKMGQAMSTVADRILAAKATEEEMGAAVQIKIQALSILERLGHNDAAKKLEAFPADLERSGRPRALVREARATLLAIHLSKATRAGAKEMEKVVAETRQFLAQGPLGEEDVDLAKTVAMTAERLGLVELAATAYSTLGDTVAADKDPDIASLGVMMQGAARRLASLGKPLEVRGKTLDGRAFDWAQYKGKVVLVVFWATWCAPCREEIQNIRENYDAYREQGFDVVGISIDREEADLVAFLSRAKLPWTVLLDEKSKDGKPAPTLQTYYGVYGIPCELLVGRDGKVVAMDLLGEQLGQKLQKLLGPPKEKKKAAEK